MCLRVKVVGLCAEHVREDFEEFRLKAKWTNALSLRVLGQGTTFGPKCYWLSQGWRAALFTSVAILSLPMRSPEWMAGVQKLVTKCGPRLRVLALEMQVSMIDVSAVVQHIAQQYVGVGRFIAAALPRLTHGAVAHQLRPAVAGALAG